MARKNPKTLDAARPLSCVLYIRVSTKLQVEKGESIDAQRFELTRYAENHGMRVLGEYVDAGFSGKNVQGRPQFRQMMDDIIKAQPSKRPAYVLVFKLSRFGRNAADTWNSLQTLQDYGVELCCVKDGIDSGTSMGKAMLSIAAVFAEMERDNIRTQTMSGREEKARKGYWNGGQAPFGYRLVDKGNKFKELEVDEDEAKVVRRIFEMYAQAEHEDARRRPREHAQRASRLPSLRSQDVVQAQPWEAQEGRHAGKDDVGLLLPAYFKSAWCQLHVQKSVPARVRGR